MTTMTMTITIPPPVRKKTQNAFPYTLHSDVMATHIGCGGDMWKWGEEGISPPQDQWLGMSRAQITLSALYAPCCQYVRDIVIIVANDNNYGKDKNKHPQTTKIKTTTMSMTTYSAACSLPSPRKTGPILMSRLLWYSASSKNSCGVPNIQYSNKGGKSANKVA